MPTQYKRVAAYPRKHNVRLSDLKKWNNLGGSARLKIGQQIAIFQRQLWIMGEWGVPSGWYGLRKVL